MSSIMTGAPRGAIEVLAERRTANARVRIVTYRFFEAANGQLRGDGKFRLDLCLNTRHRGARACFQEAWGPLRFEPVGDLFVVHPHADLIAKSDEDRDQVSVVCELDAKPLIDLFSSTPERSDFLLQASLDVRSPKIKDLLQWMADEVRRPGFASEAILETMIGHLRIELVRHGHHVLEETKGARGTLTAAQLRAIEDRLDQASASPTLMELSALCGLSVRQLSRRFRASKGCSLGTYVARRQLGHAKRLLADGRSVAIIAYQLGFATSSAFCHAFRRGMSITPGEYRKRLPRRP